MSKLISHASLRDFVCRSKAWQKERDAIHTFVLANVLPVLLDKEKALTHGLCTRFMDLYICYALIAELPAVQDPDDVIPEETVNSRYGTAYLMQEFITALGIGENALCDAALDNRKKLMPCHATSLDRLAAELLGEEIPDIETFSEEQMKNGELTPYPENATCPLHVLVTDSGLYGAAAMLDKDLLAGIAKSFGNFYVLPSSVHELIILPDDGKAAPEELKRIVHEVNGTENITENNFLSDSVYRYDKKNGHLEPVSCL